jgi:predicted protein tyrosine phosphatase
MPIVATYALPRSYVQKMAHENDGRPEADDTRWGATWLVSITDPGSRPVRMKPDQKVLALQFADFELENVAEIDAAPPEFRGWDSPEHRAQFVADLIQPEQADRIVAHIAKAHARPGAQVFVAQCEAGVSRSAAVAAFVAELVGIDPAKVQEMSPRTQCPNTYVEKMLREAWARRNT